MSLLKEFKEFLYEYKVIPLAIAFIMGVAITALITSLVNDIIMPVISPLIPGGDWKTATFAIGSVIIRWGSFLSALINFVIIAFVVFLIAKFVLRKEKVEKI
jgi:large conductance mechanosensitive channel